MSPWKRIHPVRYLPTKKVTHRGYPIHLDLWNRKYVYFMMDIHGVVKKKPIAF